jgi:class 3 adenylate cyclase
VLLFADVSGYSALTRWMATHFEQGPWATGQVLNKLFGGVATCVEAHGGDILKFAGDAVLVCWPLDDDGGEDGVEARRAAAAAAACAMCMLNLEPTTPASGEPPVALHIALHCGEVAEMHVGNGDALGGRWEHMCAGTALDALAPLIRAAASGQCVASHALWRLLDGAAARGEACADGARVLALTPAAAAAWRHAQPLPAQLQRPAELFAQRGGGSATSHRATTLAALATYVPPALTDSLEASHTAWLAELRYVSVLFILLPPCGAHDFALAQALVAEVHECVGRTGGTPQQSLVDDKGFVSIGVYGKPMASHADDPARALAAALELTHSLRRIAAAHGRTEPISCGVATGRAFCGNVGTLQRCEWAVVGDVMNNAARLMGACAVLDRPVLCDAATARHISDAAAEAGLSAPEWLSAPPLSVAMKGAAAVVRVYAPEEQRPETPDQRRSVDGAVRRRGSISGSVTESAGRSSFASHRSSMGSSAGGERGGSGGGSRRGGSRGSLDSLRGGGGGGAGYAPFSDDDSGGAVAAAAGTASRPGSGSPPVRRSFSSGAVMARTSGPGGGIPRSSNGSRGSIGTAFPATTERRRSNDGPSALVGREAELARCALLLREPSTRSGLLLIVSGGVSCGKSAFLRAVATAAVAAGSALLPLARTEHAAAGGCLFNMRWFADAVDARLDVLPPALRPLAPLLARLVPAAGFDPHALATPASAAALRALDADADATDAALAALAVEVLRPTLGASAGAILLADDASGLDARSVSLLAAVMAALRPSLLLSLPRQELEDPASCGAEMVAALAAVSVTTRTCMLGSLPPAAVGALCASEMGVSGVAALPPGLVPALMRLAGGHPLLLKEQLALLVRDGHLVVDAAAGRVRVTCDMARLPELVSQGLLSEEGVARMEVFIQRRIDALSAEARAVVKAAAVLGGTWDLALLVRCCNPRLSFAAVCTAAAELVHEGMWTFAPGAGGDAVASGGDASGGAAAERPDGGAAARYCFAHEVVRSLVYAATPEDTRAALNAAVLACLEVHGELGGAASTWSASAGGDAPQSAVVWSELARLARGAAQHAKAAACLLHAARVSAASGAVTGPADAARAAQEGLDSLHALGEHVRRPRAISAASSAASPVPRLSVDAGMRRRRASCTGDCIASPSTAAAAPTGDAVADAEHADDEQADDPECAELRRELCDILARVKRIQASWALVQPGLEAHALAMTHAFVGRAPHVVELVTGKAGTPLTDPSMGAVMVRHQMALLTLVGTCVAGQRDFDALAPTLVQCGRMHSRFGDSIQQFYPHCGAAMMDAVHAALGDEFTPEVEAAWSAVYNFVALNMLKGLDAAQGATAAESALRDILVGPQTAFAA